MFNDIQNEITMINENNGASLIIANTLLKSGKIKKVIYLDTHNPGLCNRKISI